MKFAFALTALLLTPTFAAPALASAPPKQSVSDAEIKAASVPVENYIKALQTGNVEYARLAFHKDARLTGNNRAGYYSVPIQEWMAGFNGTPNADEAQRKRSFRILDLTPTTGVARVDLAYPDVTFVDYMPLLKVDGEWKIIEKVFHAYRAPVAAQK